MDNVSIILRVSQAKDRRDLPSLIQDLKLTNPKLLFETLFPIASRRQEITNGPVAFSAYVLHAVNPPRSMSIEDAVNMMIVNEWDISIEEVPWYLANQFGQERLNHCVNDASGHVGDEDALVRLNTIRYWNDQRPEGRRPKR